MTEEQYKEAMKLIAELGSIRKAAEAKGIPYPTFRRRLRRYEQPTQKPSVMEQLADAIERYARVQRDLPQMPSINPNISDNYKWIDQHIGWKIDSWKLRD